MIYLIFLVEVLVLIFSVLGMLYLVPDVVTKRLFGMSIKPSIRLIFKLWSRGGF